MGIFDRKEGTFMGYKIFHEEKFDMLEELAVLIIASMYYDDIMDRIKKHIGNITNILVFDNYEELIVEKDIIPFNDNKYSILKNLIIHDAYSRIVLEKIIDARKNNNYLSYYNDVKGLQGSGEYWGDFEPKNNYKKCAVFDCGAYIGDSIAEICRNVDGKVKYYYAIEADSVNYKKLVKQPKSTEMYEQLITIKKAVGDKNCIVNFEESSIGDSSHIVEGDSINNCIEMIKIDDIPIDEELDIYIKADIEGSELAMLKGAENLIRTRHPHLAICLYHKSNDIANIPLYLKSICPNYKFYLRMPNHIILIAEYENN